MENINEYHKNVGKPKNLRETMGEDAYQKMVEIAREADKRLAEKEAIKKAERQERARYKKYTKKRSSIM